MTMTAPNYPANAKLPSSKCVSSRFQAVGLVACLHKTAFSFGRRLYSRLCLFHAAQPLVLNNAKRRAWSLRSSVDGSGLDPSPTNSTNGGTRLLQSIQAFRIKLNARVQEIRKDLPIKLLFFLVGFYCATAFATVIGQTGDWDILSAALAVAVVEGIGALMYKGSLPLFDKIRGLITIFNFWKAGLSMGLFLDSFKYEMDLINELCNLEILTDVFELEHCEMWPGLDCNITQVESLCKDDEKAREPVAEAVRAQYIFNNTMYGSEIVPLLLAE